MDGRSLQLLELPEMIERLAAECATTLGAEGARGLAPATTLNDCQGRLADTAEAAAFLATRRIPPCGGIADVRALTKRAQAAGALTPDELLQIAEALTGLRRLSQSVTGPEGRDQQRLLQRAGRIRAQPNLENEIRAAIDTRHDDLGASQDSARAAVKDEASEALRRIRRALRSLGEQIQTRLRRLIGSAEFQKFLQEPLFTMRDDRYVVPVKSAHRHEVKGLIHDRSSTGATVFIEPQELVDLNNELKQFRLDERDEVERILRKLSAEVGRHRAVIDESLAAAAELDLLFARARLAEKMRATRPTLNDDGVIEVKEVRHPLLDEWGSGRMGEGRETAPTTLAPARPIKVVPINLRLGSDFDALFLTGPNTGGKTVTLKTLGLITLMAQCGLFVPCAAGARLAVFERVFADIGDEQSIEQNLSTFSSHIERIIQFLRKADAKTLVLLDEIGAGTDPDEGAALGKAIVRSFLRAGAKVVVTTHYGELKLFAAAQERMENASVEFDAKTLRPTYHLRIGVPGSSNAFRIAQRLGMPWVLIKRARHFLRRDRHQAAKVIRELERSQQELERESELATQAREEAESLRETYDEKVASARAQRQRILHETHAQAQEYLHAVRAEADEILRRLRSQTRESKDTETARVELKQLEQKVHTDTRSAEPAPREEQPTAPPAPLVAGATVWIASLKQHGEVVAVPDARGRVSIHVGNATVELDAGEVVAAEPPKLQASAGLEVALQARKSVSVPLELHLRGIKVEEALPLLDKYLDDALLASLDRVRIVHGKGAGTMKRVVHEVLRRHPNVQSFHLAEAHEGAEGVTVVTLG